MSLTIERHKERRIRGKGEERHIDSRRGILQATSWQIDIQNLGIGRDKSYSCRNTAVFQRPRERDGDWFALRYLRNIESEARARRGDDLHSYREDPKHARKQELVGHATSDK